jgi:endonuclease/exonuclease/phosphatase (EEP) superfamily protein YafD
MSCLTWVMSLLALGGIAALTLLAYLTSHYGWPIYLELFSHFQVQYLGLALLLLGGLLLLRHKGLVWVGLLLCAALSLPILTWYLPPRLTTDSANGANPDLRVLIANLNTQNQSYSKVLNLTQAENPDLAIFLEVSAPWKVQLDQLRTAFPYLSAPSSSDPGVVVYSKQPLQDTQIDFFGTERNPSVITQLTVANEPVTLVATHPLPPIRPSFFHSRNRQLAGISDYLANVDQRMILAGDLNTTMWSPYYQRLVNRTRLSNTRKGFGILPTWPTSGTYTGIPDWLTSLMQIPIDHCLISSGLKTTRMAIGSDTGSDHKPLIVDLQITRR